MENWDWLHTKNNFLGAKGMGTIHGVINKKKPVFDFEIIEQENCSRLIFNTSDINDELREVLQMLIYKLHFFAFKKQNKGINFYFSYGNFCFQALYKSKIKIEIYKEDEMKQCLLLEKFKSL